MKWVNILFNNKNIIEKVNNGTADEYDKCIAEAIENEAAKDVKAWQLRCTLAAERFNKECFNTEANW